tara:strand:- start:1108 stop:1356 length:249 start_codon:yes stop_codon:yes gene_type:complete
MREAKIAKPRVGRETPMDANVQIPGFGVMTRKQMRGSIQRYIAEVSKYIKKGDVDQAYNIIYKRNVLKGFLETEIQHSGKKL